LISLNLLKLRSAVLRIAVIGKLSLEWPQAPILWAPAVFFQGGNVDIFLILFRLLTMQCKWTFTKRFTPTSQKEIAPFYSNSHNSHKIRFGGSKSQVYCDKLQNRLSADFKQGTF